MATENNNIDAILLKISKCSTAISKLTKTIRTLNEQRLFLKNKAKIISFIEFKKIIKELKDAKIKLIEINKESDELLRLKFNYEKTTNKKP